MAAPPAPCARRIARPIVSLVPVLTFLIWALAWGPASAHLSLIREGGDSDGAAELNDQFGTAMAAGDFNGDGFDDLASGAPRDDHSGAADGQYHGTVVVSPGSAFGLTHVGAYERQFTDDFTDNDVRFGQALAVGNFNGDLYDDLVVGAPYRDYIGAQNAGAIYVYTGSASGLSNTATVYTQVDCGGTREAGDLFGYALTVGDFDANGVDDLAIGSPGEDTGAGAVFYMYSTAGVGLDPVGAGTGFFKQGDLAQTGKDNENFGWSLAAGPAFAAGSWVSLIVGAPHDRPGSGLTTPTGRVTIIPSDGSNGLVSLGSVNFNSIELGVPFSNTASGFGWSLATGKLIHNSGGVDIAIGEPLNNAGGAFHAGRVVVYQFSSPVHFYDITDIPGDFTVHGDEDFFGWSLATGDMDLNGFDELAVGTPNKNALNNTVNWGGMLTVFEFACTDSTNATTTPCSSSVNLDQEELHDLYREAGMGWSVAFGNFDESGLGAFAVGAPIADFLVWVDLLNKGTFVGDNSLDIVEAGQVHIYAPHRQVLQLRSRSACLVNCEGDLIQSQRMFDELPMASATKAMTNFIAAEHVTHAGSWGTDSLTGMVVPNWIGSCMAKYGSSALLKPMELVSLIDLMRMSLMISGNDASVAVAWHITGQTYVFPSDTTNCSNRGHKVPSFADSMNVRAAEIGMTDTHFANSYGSNHSDINGFFARTTAWDYVKLGRRVMKNDVFRMLTSTEKKTIERTLPGDVWNQEFKNGFLDGIRDNFPLNRSMVQGIKPGGTPDAKTTGLAAARWQNEDDTIASIFGVEDGNWSEKKLADLLALGINNCDVFQANVVPIPPPPEPEASKSGVSTDADSSTAVGLSLNEVGGNDVLVEVYPDQLLTSTATLNLRITRSLSYVIPPGESRTLSATPFESHHGIILRNDSETSAADLQIAHNQPLGTGHALFLPADSDSMVVPPSSFPSTSLDLTITNLSSTEPARVHLHEVGHNLDIEVGFDTRIPDSFSAQLSASDDPTYHSMQVLVTGQDTGVASAGDGLLASAPGPGNTVSIVVRQPGVTTAVREVGPGARPPGSGVVHSARSYPNPFNPQATIAFTLTARAPVTLHIFDVRGRRVRALVHNRTTPPGDHRVTWDGTGESGQRVSSGLYFYRVTAGPTSVTGKMLLLK